MAMRIGFFTYSEYSLRPYFETLKNRAHCTWVVFNWHLYRELKASNSNHDALLFFNNPLGLKLHPNINKVVNQCYRWLGDQRPDHKTCELLIAKAKADLWIADSTLLLNKFSKVKVPKILVFHAISYKEYILIEETMKYDLVLLPSEYFKQRMLEKFPSADPDRLKVVGWPRNDVYFQSIYSREKTLTRLGLDPAKKTVIFAPSHDVFARDRFFPASWGSLEENFEQMCKAFKKLDSNFIVKLHSISHTIIRNKKLRSIARKYKAFWYNEYNKYYLEDPRELLYASDVLISDISGVIMDFLPLDKPIVYVHVEDPSFWEKADLARGDRAGFCVNNVEELISAAIDGLENPRRHQAERARLSSKVFYQPDGHATERAGRAILEFLNQRGFNHASKNSYSNSKNPF